MVEFKSVSPKMNVTVQLEFELDNYNVASQHFIH